MNSPKTVKSFFSNVLKQAVPEASEEVNTTLANTAADLFIMGDKSQYQTEKRQYMAQGMTAAQAEKQAGSDWFRGLMADAFGGAISGGLFATGANAVNGFRSRRNGNVSQQILMDTQGSGISTANIGSQPSAATQEVQRNANSAQAGAKAESTQVNTNYMEKGSTDQVLNMPQSGPQLTPEVHHGANTPYSNVSQSVQNVNGSPNQQVQNNLASRLPSILELSSETLREWLQAAGNTGDSLSALQNLYTKNGMAPEKASRTVLQNLLSRYADAFQNDTGGVTAQAIAEAAEKDRLERTLAGENVRYNGTAEALVEAALRLPQDTEARNLADQVTIARQAEILGKLEELEAAKKQAGTIQTPRQLQEFMKTVGHLEQELEALEQGRLSDRLDSETLGRLAAAVQNGQAELTAAEANDIIDSIAEPYIETLKTINMKLEGKRHPVTGVLYKRYRFELDGRTIEAVGPEFETPYTAHLPKDQYFASDRVHNRICSLELYEAAMKDPQLREICSEKQINDLKKGKKPRGYTWHHNVVTGEMQLVDYETHRNTPHTGGRNIWGGGAKYR